MARVESTDYTGATTPRQDMELGRDDVVISDPELVTEDDLDSIFQSQIRPDRIQATIDMMCRIRSDRRFWLRANT